MTTTYEELVELRNRVDQLEEELDSALARIGTLEAEVDGERADVRDSIGELIQRIERLETSLEATDHRGDSIEELLGDAFDRIEALEDDDVDEETVADGGPDVDVDEGDSEDPFLRAAARIRARDEAARQEGADGS